MLHYKIIHMFCSYREMLFIYLFIYFQKSVRWNYYGYIIYLTKLYNINNTKIYNIKPMQCSALTEFKVYQINKIKYCYT